MMTTDELEKTIQLLKDYVAKMKSRPDYDALKEQVDRLEGEIRRLVERANALQHGKAECHG
jgi:hypothetical protein